MNWQKENILFRACRVDIWAPKWVKDLCQLKLPVIVPSCRCSLKILWPTLIQINQLMWNCHSANTVSSKSEQKYLNYAVLSFQIGKLIYKSCTRMKTCVCIEIPIWSLSVLPAQMHNRWWKLRLVTFYISQSHCDMP